jgi:hypothetical protein
MEGSLASTNQRRYLLPDAGRAFRPWVKNLECGRPGSSVSKEILIKVSAAQGCDQHHTGGKAPVC